MPDRHAVGVNLDGASTKRLVPEPPGGVLNRETLRRRIRSDVYRLDMDGHSELRREFTAELLVAPSFRPKLVIHMRQADDEETTVL
jgi:hypothetical protein